MHKTILLTGSTGTLGHHLSVNLKSKGHTVIPFKGNLLDSANIQQQVDDQSFDTVAHLAAMVPVKEVDAAPSQAYKVNVCGTINLLQALIAQKQRYRFFYASSSHIYKSKDTPICESDQLDPATLYGRTKLHAEQIAQDICKNSQIRFTAGRIFSFYDERQKSPFLYPAIKARLANEDLSQPFELFGANGSRDICSAQEITEKIVALIESETEGIYNIGTGTGTRIRDFVQGLSPVKLEIVSKGKSNHLIANTTKFNALFQE